MMIQQIHPLFGTYMIYKDGFNFTVTLDNPMKVNADELHYKDYKMKFRHEPEEVELFKVDIDMTKTKVNFFDLEGDERQEIADVIDIYNKQVLDELNEKRARDSKERQITTAMVRADLEKERMKEEGSY